MSFASCRPLPILALLGAALLPLSDAKAQVPVGSIVVGTFAAPTLWGPAFGGPTGLFLVDAAGVVTPVTGLPPHLTLPSLSTPGQQGIASVAYRPADGAIVVGTVASATGGPTSNIELFLFYLSGSAVTGSVSVTLGTTTSTGGASVNPLPDGRILVQVSEGAGNVPLAAGPMAGSYFAIVDVSTATITPLPNPTVVPKGGAAVDPTGQFLYYTNTITSPTPVVTSLYRWDRLSPATPPCQIMTWPGRRGGAANVCDDDGTVYVVTNFLSPATNYIDAIRPNGCSPATTTNTTNSLSLIGLSVALDRATGTYLVAESSNTPAGQNRLCRVDPATGAGVVIAGGPGVWGAMGVCRAMHHAIDSFGKPTHGANHYWFETFPNPGSLPTLPNPTFSLTMRAAPAAPAWSALGISFGRGALSVLGCQVYVDPAAVQFWSLPGSLSSTVGIPLPNLPAFRGVQLTAQSLNVEASGTLATSCGLSITLL